MNKEINEAVKRLSFENIIWLVFIGISALDIYGDELLKKNLLYHDKVAQKKATKLFITITLVTIPIYIYFLVRNYHDYQKYKTKNYEQRLIGSIFILIGTLYLLSFQLNTRSQSDSPSNV